MQGKKNPPKNCVCEREREVTFFCKGKLCIEQKKEWQIYSKRLRMRRDKIKEDKEKEEE